MWVHVLPDTEDCVTARLDPPPCNGRPPRGIKDPFVRRWAVQESNRKAVKGFRSTWERAIRDHVQLDPTVGYIAMLVATHTDYDSGWNAWPGEERLAEYTGRTTRTVRNALAWLEEHGFLTREVEGRRTPHRNYADVYKLSLPAPLAHVLGMWPEDEPMWMERARISRPSREWLPRAG